MIYVKKKKKLTIAQVTRGSIYIFYAKYISKKCSVQTLYLCFPITCCIVLIILSFWSVMSSTTCRAIKSHKSTTTNSSTAWDRSHFMKDVYNRMAVFGCLFLHKCQQPLRQTLLVRRVLPPLCDNKGFGSSTHAWCVWLSFLTTSAFL